MIETVLVLWFIHFCALLIPGPNVLLVSHTAASGLHKEAAWISVGVALGSALWSLLALLGINSVFHAFPALRGFLQLAGALYLIYLGLRLWRREAPNPESLQVAQSARRNFALGLLTNLSNPKSALFYGSLLSTLLPGSLNYAHLAGLVALFGLNALFFYLALSWVFSRPLPRHFYEAQAQIIRRSVGFLFGAMGAALIMSLWSKTSA